MLESLRASPSHDFTSAQSHFHFHLSQRDECQLTEPIHNSKVGFNILDLSRYLDHTLVGLLRLIEHMHPNN